MSVVVAHEVRRCPVPSPSLDDLGRLVGRTGRPAVHAQPVTYYCTHDNSSQGSYPAACTFPRIGGRGRRHRRGILSRRLLTFPRRALGRTLTVLQSGRLLVGPAQRKPGDRQRRGTWRRLNGDGRTSAPEGSVERLSLIHISEPTRLGMISYAVFCLKKK